MGNNVSIIFPVIDPLRDILLQEADRPAEKVLDLPARSRFGEGRAEPLIDLIRGPLSHVKRLLLRDDESYS